MQYPTPKFHQALLEDWTLTDGSGVVDTVSDQTDGSCDILTTATAGDFNFRLPIKDYLGGPVDPSAGALMVLCYCRLITATNLQDRVGVGLRDTAAGDNQYASVRDNGDLLLTAFGTTNATAGTADRLVFPVFVHKGQTEYTGFAYGYSSPTTYTVHRALAMVTVAFDPSHLYVEVRNDAAAIQTISIEAGFFVYPTIPDALAVTERA